MAGCHAEMQRYHDMGRGRPRPAAWLRGWAVFDLTRTAEQEDLAETLRGGSPSRPCAR